MKHYVKSALATLIVASGTAFSATPPEGWYVGLLGGLSYAPGIDFSISSASFTNINNGLFFLVAPPMTSRAGEVKYSIGGGGGGQLGYSYCNFRFEGQLLFNYSPYDKLSLGGYTIKKNQNTSLVFPFSNLTISGSNTTLGAGLFNVFYDFYDQDYDDVTWMPYVGLGVGYAYIKDKFDLNFISPPDPITGNTISTKLLTFRDNTKTPIAQAIVGISYLIEDNFSAGLDYRYITTKKISHFNERFVIHTFNLNINYWWNI